MEPERDAGYEDSRKWLGRGQRPRSRQARIACRTLMRDERRDLRHFLEQLTPEQWQQRSLCREWSVRDIVAHLTEWDDLLLYRSRREYLRVFLRFATLYALSFGSLTRLNHRIQSKTGSLGRDALLGRFSADDSEALKWLFDGSNPGAHLAEYVIHHQDIRRPPGMPRHIPGERLIAALNGVTQLPSVRWSAWRHLRRHRWEATDVDWRRGHGAVVTGPGEAILMALVARPAAREELRGL